MMTATVLGLGACGNKAAIRLMELGIVDKSHVKLLNTTSKDVPDLYLTEPGLYVPFANNELGGAGKESSKGRAYMIDAITNKKIDFSQLINEDANEVILVSSLEGGSGSGSTPVVAQYLDAMNIPVHVFGFVGFQQEVRSINNTLKFFKDLPENAILHTILNSHFLDYTKNYSKAEAAANDEFAMEVQILLGMKLVTSSHNIDDQDLYKVNTQPGYMTIDHILLENIKNVEAFNKLISAAYEDACYMDTDPSAKRIAVMINATKRTQEMIDNSFEVLKRYTGTPIELFQHIQQKVRQRNISNRGSGLRSSHLDGSFAFCPIGIDTLNRFGDMKNLLLKVNICPFQGASFPDTHTCEHCQHDAASGVAVFLGDRVNELFLLRRCEHGGFPCFLLRKLCIPHKVGIIMGDFRPFSGGFYHNDHIRYVLCRQSSGKFVGDKRVNAGQIELAVFQCTKIRDKLFFQLMAIACVAAFLD